MNARTHNEGSEVIESHLKTLLKTFCDLIIFSSLKMSDLC